MTGQDFRQSGTERITATNILENPLPNMRPTERSKSRLAVFNWLKRGSALRYCPALALINNITHTRRFAMNK